MTFTAGEVKNPSRNLPLSLALGTILVISLYLLANLAYLAVLSFHDIQNAPQDRVASQTMEAIFKGWGEGLGAGIMAAAIMVSTFGCNNGLILAGSRLLYAMSLDGLFFRAVRKLNSRHVPARAMILRRDLRGGGRLLDIAPHHQGIQTGRHPQGLRQSLQ